MSTPNKTDKRTTGNETQTVLWRKKMKPKTNNDDKVKTGSSYRAADIVSL